MAAQLRARRPDGSRTAAASNSRRPIRDGDQRALYRFDQEGIQAQYPHLPGI